MVSWNYYDAGQVDDKEKSKHMTERERFYAVPLRNKLDFFSFINMFTAVINTITYFGII